MKSKSRITAAFLGLALLLTSLTACGEDTVYAAEINGKSIAAGIYINYQSMAYAEAAEFMSEEDQTAGKPVLSTTVEGLPAESWINNRAVEMMKEHVAIDEKFAELGLTYTDDSDASVLAFVEQYWEYYQEALTDIGVSQESYAETMLNAVKKTELLKYYYGTGGTLEVPEADIKAYLLENNARINFIAMELKDGAGNFLQKEEDKAARMAMAEDYVKRAEAGEDFNVLLKEYNEWYTALQAAANPETAADTATTPAEIDPAVTEAVTEAVTTDATTTTTEAAATTAEAVTTTEGETTAPVTDEATTTTEATTTATTEVTTEAAATAATETVPEVITPDISTDSDELLATNEQIITKEDKLPTVTVNDKVFAEQAANPVTGTANRYFIVTDSGGEFYYVVELMDLFSDPLYYDSVKDSAISGLKSDELDATIAGWAAALKDVKLNQKALDRYKVSKIGA
jgi:hypothetical protein